MIGMFLLLLLDARRRWRREMMMRECPFKPMCA
jgi:hypothetical protein